MELFYGIVVSCFECIFSDQSCHLFISYKDFLAIVSLQADLAEYLTGFAVQGWLDWLSKS